MSDFSRLKIKQLPKSLVQFELEVTDDILKKWKPLAYKKLSAKANISGFRPGNIPDSVLEEQYTPEFLKAHVIDTAFPHIYADIVKEKDLKVIAQPEVKEKSIDPLILEVTVAVLPEISLGNYKKIKIPKKELKVTSKEVDTVIEDIRKRNAVYKDVDRASKMNDRVEIDFVGFDSKGQKMPEIESKNHPIVLGSKGFIPGFEEQLMGMKKGEKKEFDLTFPKEYHNKEFQNKKIHFAVTLNRIEESELPNRDEAFIEKISGKKQSEDEFKKMVESNLIAQMKQQMREQRENELFGKIRSITKVEIPEIMLKEELDYMVKNLKQRLQQQKIDWEHYLKHLKKTEDEIRKSMETEASDRIIVRLALNKIIEEEKTEVAEEDIKTRIDHYSQFLPKDDPQFESMYKKDSSAYNQLVQQIKIESIMEIFLGKEE